MSYTAIQSGLLFTFSKVTSVRQLVAILCVLATYCSPLAAQTSDPMALLPVVTDSLDIGEVAFEPVTGVRDAYAMSELSEPLCNDHHIMMGTDQTISMLSDTIPLPNEDMTEDQMAAYYELLLLADAAYEDRDLLQRVREVAPTLREIQRFDIYQRSKKSSTVWAILLNIIPPTVGNIITDDWAGVGYYAAGLMLNIATGMIKTESSTVRMLLIAPGAAVMIYAVFRPVFKSFGIARFNKDLRDALGIASTASLDLAPVLVPSMASQFTPGVGLRLRF